MVELCSRVEIGVGFFIVVGSYGCKLNWVDFLVVVRISLNSKNGRRGVRFLLEESIFVKFYELNLRVERVINVISLIFFI